MLVLRNGLVGGWLRAHAPAENFLCTVDNDCQLDFNGSVSILLQCLHGTCLCYVEDFISRVILPLLIGVFYVFSA